MVVLFYYIYYNSVDISDGEVRYVGLLENLLGIQQPDDYTVKDNRTGRETGVRDAEELEKFARQQQDDRYGEHKDFIQRIFSR
ncbi:hypothetical protein IKL45_01960 [Candidatus Saccharibacteria bacterium]|nr:hypothetical protein [Candidatus Saccharibacteria bacterium]